MIAKETQKPFYKSKIIILNALAFTVAFITYLGVDITTIPVDEELLIGAIAVVNIVLRFVTDKKIQFDT